jgi:hypothetical protein
LHTEPEGLAITWHDAGAWIFVAISVMRNLFCGLEYKWSL